MAKSTLSEISNWVNTGEEIYHDFTWITTYEKRIITDVVRMFILEHPEYKVTEPYKKVIRVCKKV